MEAASASTRGRNRSASKWGLVVGLLVVAVVASVASESVADIVGPLGVMFGQGIAGWLVIRNSRDFQGRERLAWRLAGTGFLIAAGGVLVVAIIGMINGSAPAFGPTDLIFVFSYVLILSGFASLPQVASTSTQRTRVFLDGLIGAVSLAALLGTLFLVDLLAQLEGAPFWERLIASIYPVLDVVMLIMLLWVSVRRSSYRFDPRLLLFGVALAVQATADMTFFVTGIGKTFEEAAPAYGLYVLAAAGFAAAGVILQRTPAPREYAEKGPPLWALLAPYGTASLLAVWVVYMEITQPDSRSSQFLLAVSALVVGLVILRQWVEIGENRRYIERQQAELVSSVSHELRTPLTSVMGVLDIVIEDEGMSPIERLELLKMARDQSVHVTRIVEDLVLLARDDEHILSISPEAVNPVTVVAEAAASLDQEGGTLTIEIPPGIAFQADRQRMVQLVANLLGNAIKYGGPNRLITARIVDGHFVLAVHDDGEGVPKRFELMVWERFERGANRLNSIKPGSGIGLAIVKSIAEAHQGNANYRRSERLGGACFEVVLPLLQELQEAMPIPEAEAA